MPAEKTDDSNRRSDNGGDETVAEREYDDYVLAERESDSEEPDVLLDVPVVKVDEIHLDVQELRARVSLQAEVLDLVRLNVGADVFIGEVGLEIKGVEAQALLKVRLDNVARILDRVLTTIDRNPQIIEHITAGVRSAVEDVGAGAGTAVDALGEGAGTALEEVGEGAGSAVEGVGEGAGAAVKEVGEGAGATVKDVGKGAGAAAEDVGRGAGAAAEGVGKGAGAAVEDAGKSARRTAQRARKPAGKAAGRAGKAAAGAKRAAKKPAAKPRAAKPSGRRGRASG